MAGYLMMVSFKVLGVSNQVLLGIADGMFPDQATAITDATAQVTAYRAAKGETITNVVCLVSATR